jgi:O-antigen/teichoic acid export membrane protein
MRNSFLRGVSMNAAGNGSVAVIGLIRNVIIARVMGPAAFGLWQVCLVALRLGGESHVGSLHALALEGPILRGGGREDEARTLEARVLGIAALFACASGIAAALVLRLNGGPGLGTAGVLLAFSVFSQQAFQAHAVLLQARRKFERVATLQFTFAVVHLAGLLLLLPSRYISGVLFAWTAGAVAAVFIIRRTAEIPIPRIPPRAAISATVRRGMSSWLVSAAFVLLLMEDRVLVGALLGREALGHYGILVLGGSALLFLPDVIAGVIWPFAGEEYGRRGRSPGALGPLALTTVRAVAPAMAAGLVLVAQGTEVLVARVLPSYAPSLDALRLYLPGVYLLGIVHLLRPILVTSGGDRALLRLFGGMLAATVTAQVAAVAAGGGMAGVALTGAAGAAVLLALTLRLAGAVLAPGYASARVGIECTGLLALALLADFALGRAGPSLDSLPGVLLRVGLPALALLGAGAAVLRIRERLPQDPGTA